LPLKQRTERLFYSTPTSSDQPPERNTKDKMASDDDYAAFLDKANQDPNEGVSKTQSSSKVELKAVDKDVDVPACLKKATKDAFYVSDADEPFEPVCLKLSGKTLPDEGLQFLLYQIPVLRVTSGWSGVCKLIAAVPTVAFAKLVNHPSPDDAEVTIMDIGEWDTQGQYKDVVDATREASKGSDVRVYRISKGGPRIEYWVVGLQGGKLVGIKALAIES